ncbi:MAG TPA: DUF427 domain-containing protein [Micromonosporaceae bacterium]|nr:DUF427 domain-containing protein [Micromonosporaceae bacterium]
MAIELADHWLRGFSELRYQPTDKRVRALIGERTVVDSQSAALVWEPRRVAPYYAVPERDVLVPLVSASRRARAVVPPAPVVGSPLLPHGGFRAHTVTGEELSIRAPGWGVGRRLEGVAFRPADPDLSGYIVLDFDAFDRWLEEDEPVEGHPRDPYHRVDVLRSSRHVRIMLGEKLLAESRRPRLVFETLLPVRFYLPREDVNQRLLRPSSRRTTCPYKGEAVYWSVQLSGYVVEDIAWSYPRPKPGITDLADLLCFFDERVEAVVDGTRRERLPPHWA